MSDETRTKLVDACVAYGTCTSTDVKVLDAAWFVVQTAMTAHEQAAKAEAVLAFAEWLDGHPRILSTAHEDFAAEFLKAQGWSETPGQAERGKP